MTTKIIDDLCACRRKHVGGHIRQEHLGNRHWRVHDRYSCYELKDSARRTIAERRNK